MRKSVVFIAIAAFVGLTAIVFAGSGGWGRIKSISGDQVTIISDTGAQMTIQSELQGLQVGDRVLVDSGKIITQQTAPTAINPTNRALGGGPSPLPSPGPGPIGKGTSIIR
jgi:hypothetical protein